ncbi:MAG: ComEC/Rec2 family competence protein [Treponema sp.]|jgi:competence protein ComEC|nr:ComEC/Rec2 family competence protein [Treponema sp.]
MVVQFLKRMRLTPLLCAAFGAITGYYILFYLPLVLTIIVLTLFVITFCFFRVLSSLNTESRTLKMASLCSTVLAVGLVLGLCAAIAGQKEVKFGIPENNITAVEGVLLEDPRIISGGKAMVSLSLRRCAAGNNLRADSSGEITVFFPQQSAEKLKEFGRGTAVFAEGRLRHTERGWTYSADSLHITKTAPVIERMRTSIRLSLIERFSGEDWGGLALALLVGIRDNLDTDFVAQYRSAGMSYILALSGMHLAILAAALAFLLKKPLGLKASAITSAIIIILYCLFVGPMPSLNRAALMYVLGVLAVIGALPKKSMSILALSFLIQLIVTPSAGNSLSFILSYLALLGILTTGKALSMLFAGKIPEFLLQPLALSCGPFIATAGICSFAFGSITPVCIIAGLVIAPLTTVFMVGSMIWLVLTLFLPSTLLSIPLSILYRLMEMTAGIAGNIPRITANPSLILALSILLFLLISVFESRRRTALAKPEPFL